MTRLWAALTIVLSYLSGVRLVTASPFGPSFWSGPTKIFGVFAALMTVPVTIQHWIKPRGKKVKKVEDGEEKEVTVYSFKDHFKMFLLHLLTFVFQSIVFSVLITDTVTGEADRLAAPILSILLIGVASFFNLEEWNWKQKFPLQVILFIVVVYILFVHVISAVNSVLKSAGYAIGGIRAQQTNSQIPQGSWHD